MVQGIFSTVETAKSWAGNHPLVLLGSMLGIGLALGVWIERGWTSRSGRRWW
jgi:hypothetical protein